VKTLDANFIIIYTCEMFMKILGKGFIFSKNAYLRDKWNILDFFVVTTAWMNRLELALEGVVDLTSLRSLRIMKPLKTIAKTKKLKVIMFAMINAAPQLYNTIIVIIFCFLIFAIGGLQIFQG
jgi:hypothetical protein